MSERLLSPEAIERAPSSTEKLYPDCKSSSAVLPSIVLLTYCHIYKMITTYKQQEHLQDQYELISQVTETEHFKIIIQTAKYFNNHYAIEDSVLHVKHHTVQHITLTLLIPSWVLPDAYKS